MNNKCKISVVLPVYNGGLYLDRLFNSLLNQIYDNFEIVCINDLSTDNTLDILYNYQKKDDRIKIYNRQTKGGTAAKGHEYALPYLTGDFFFTITHDDYIDFDYFEKMIDAYNKTQAEVVLSNLVLCYTDGNKRIHNKYPRSGDYNTTATPLEMFYDTYFWHHHCLGIFKLDLVKKYGLKADYYNSCEYYRRIEILHCNKIAFADTNYYYENGNPNSITKGEKYFHADVLYTQSLLCEEIYKSNYTTKEKRIALNYLEIMRHKLFIKTYFLELIKKRFTKEEKDYIKTIIKKTDEKISEIKRYTS